MASQSITYDFIGRGAGSLARDFRQTGDAAGAASRGAAVLQRVIGELGQKENRTAKESALLARALRMTGDAEDRVAARAVVADLAVRRLDDAMDDTSASTKKATGVMDSFRKSLDVGGMTMFQKGLLALNVSTGVGEAAVSALTVTLGAAASAATLAAAGLAAYAAAMAPALNQIKEIGKAQDILTTAQRNAESAYLSAIDAGMSKQKAAQQRAKALTDAQNQYKAATEGIPPAVLQFSNALDKAKKTWMDWAGPLQTPIFKPLIAALGLARPALDAITPLVRQASSAMAVLIKQASTSIAGGGLAAWVKSIAPYVRPVLIYMGRAIGHIIAGLGGIIRTFAPFAAQMTAGVERITKRFAEWGQTLGSHSGFQSLIKMWRENWPTVRQGLEYLGQILFNIVKAMASIATPSNSRLLWQVANPLLSLAARLSANPALVQAFLYLTLIGKGAGQITKVFDSLKTGWNAMAGVVSALTGGKISLGMQGAGNTMMAASVNMQRAANTMAGASGVAGKGGAAGTAAGAGAAGGGLLSKLGRGLAGAAMVTVGTMVVGSVLGPAAGPGSEAARKNWEDTPGFFKKVGSFLFGGTENFQNLSSWIYDHLTAPFQNWMKGKGWTTDAGAGTAAAGKMATAWAKARSEVEATRRMGGQAFQIVQSQFLATAKTAAQARADVGYYTTALVTLGDKSQATRGYRRQLIADLVNSGVDARTARGDVNRLGDAVRRHGQFSDQARDARRRLNNDIEQAFKDSQQGRADMNRLTDAVRHHSVNSDQVRGARRRLINDLVDSGVDARTARDMVNRLIGALRNLKSPPKVRIDVAAHGTWAVVQGGGHVVGPGGQRGARGLFIRAGTGPTADDVVARVSKGELIVPARMVSAGLVDHLRGVIPGFASGGYVARSYSDGPGGEARWLRPQPRLTLEALERATAKAAAAALREAQRDAAGGYGGYGVPPRGPLQAYAMALLRARGWGGQWGAFNSLVMGESGWNPYARNPSSGAYGIPQALPPGKMAAAGADWASSGFTQLRWMMGYLASVYGSPARAYAMWSSRSPHWYDQGGVLPPGLSLSYNGTGRPEPLIPARSRSGGATVVNVNVTVGHGTHPVAAAQEIAKVLNAGAASGVRLRRSILAGSG